MKDKLLSAALLVLWAIFFAATIYVAYRSLSSGP